MIKYILISFFISFILSIAVFAGYLILVHTVASQLEMATLKDYYGWAVFGSSWIVFIVVMTIGKE